MPYDGTSIPKSNRAHISFNNPHGALPVVRAWAFKKEIDPDLVVPDNQLSLLDGAIVAWPQDREGITAADPGNM